MNNIRFYKKNFLTPGIVSYNDIDDGVLLLKKETIDKALNTFKDKPVIITHDGTEPVGKVIDCYYDSDTANYICIFYVDNPEAIDLLDNQGQSISCTYDCLDYGDSGTYHNIPYDKEAKNISFVNLAIVEKPRYQEAKEYINGLENGGPGSGNWGHKGRKGQVGGSGKGGNNKERVKYGARLGMLNRASKKNKNKKDLLKKIDKVKETRKKLTQKQKDTPAPASTPAPAKKEHNSYHDYIKDNYYSDYWNKYYSDKYKDESSIPDIDRAIDYYSSQKAIDKKIEDICWDEGVDYNRLSSKQLRNIGDKVEFNFNQRIAELLRVKDKITNNTVFDKILSAASGIAQYAVGDRLLELAGINKKDINPKELLKIKDEYNKENQRLTNKEIEFIKPYEKSKDFNETYNKLVKDLEDAKKEAKENPKKDNFTRQAALISLYDAARNAKEDDFKKITSKLIEEKKDYQKEEEQKLEDVFNRVIKNNNYTNGGKGSGRKGHKTLKPVTIDGRRKFKDYKEENKYFIDLYNKKHKGKIIKTSYGKDVLLGRKAGDETNFKSYGFTPALAVADKLVKTAEPETLNEPLYKKRNNDIESFDKLKHIVKYKNKIQKILIEIRNHKRGNKKSSVLHMIKKENKTGRPTL